ncbi:unnamed protein product [Phytomonas sp. Hart1]|nr:unnamed protein product [Phytomonas sp. Hart1]|eukprot:CCW70635.1 unnamed protein product [Phytomonas sp. isolate Hart1]
MCTSEKKTLEKIRLLNWCDHFIKEKIPRKQKVYVSFDSKASRIQLFHRIIIPLRTKNFRIRIKITNLTPLNNNISSPLFHLLKQKTGKEKLLFLIDKFEINNPLP